MQSPKVSFVVPCYKLGHLLAECVNSILSQTYTDFEILILDDKSPDNTAEVSKSFTDSRVTYIQNPENLGNLRNYNKGIGLARGKYIWLISADDFLIRPYVLERYVGLMDSNPHVGYTFCPGIRLKNGKEAGVTGTYGERDCVIKGQAMLKALFDRNFVLAASVMVRRECYETIDVFPLKAEWGGIPVDMKWLGDWYLWCVFALAYDVGYFAEPMVCYREHDLSMSNSITQKEIVQSCADSDIGMLWMMRQKAIGAKSTRIAEDCMLAIKNEYRQQAIGKQFRASTYTMSLSHLEESLHRSTNNEIERNRIRAFFFDGVGDRHLSCQEESTARHFYLSSLRKDPRLIKVYAKLLLLSFGKPGAYLRRMVGGLRRVSSGLRAV